MGFSSLSHHHEPWLLLGDAVRGMTFVKGFSFDLNRKAVASRGGLFFGFLCSMKSPSNQWTHSSCADRLNEYGGKGYQPIR